MGTQGLQTGTTPVLLVYGPTASGKSALAIQLAHHYNGEIINTDSMQVYQNVPLLTAQPCKSEQNGIKHHLYGHMDPSQTGSVGVWLSEALRSIKMVRERHKTPILVGGTGLYFEALTRGLASIPKVGLKASAEAAALLQSKGVTALRDEVQRVDPAAAARILGADHQRLLRALGVYLETGKSLSAYQKNTRPVLASGSWLGMVLTPERSWLYERIAARFEQMTKAGALDEARFISVLNLPEGLPVLKALGLNPLVCHINDQISLDNAIEIAVRDTRRYAKRQYTWASGRFASWPKITAQSLAGQKEEAIGIIDGGKVERLEDAAK